MMKNIIFITGITLFLFSCNKAPNRPLAEQKEDSLSALVPLPDSNRVKTESSAEKVRTINADTITVETDGSKLPLRIEDTFTNDRQFFVLKIKNMDAGKLSASVKPQNENMNIRINQIRTPDGEFDGPFGRDLKDYPISEKGEVWLRIGKSMMASGDGAGNFSVLVN